MKKAIKDIKFVLNKMNSFLEFFILIRNIIVLI